MAKKMKICIVLLIVALIGFGIYYYYAAGTQKYFQESTATLVKKMENCQKKMKSVCDDYMKPCIDKLIKNS